MIGSHDIAKRNFRAEKLSIGGDRERASFTKTFRIFSTRDTDFPVGNIFASCPLAFLIDEPRVFSCFGK